MCLSFWKHVQYLEWEPTNDMQAIDLDTKQLTEKAIQ